MANLGLKVADVISKFYDVREDDGIRGLYEVRKKNEPNGDLLWYFFSSNNATYHSTGNDCVIRDINQSNSRYIERLIAAFEKAKNKEKKFFWLVLVYGEGIGLIPQEMEWIASIETKVDFNSITGSLRMTTYPIGKQRSDGWNPCCKRVEQDKYFNTTFMSCKNEDGEFTDAYMRDYFEIYDNRPYRDLVEVEYTPENEGEDIFKYNLYGIHITKKNDALSEDNPHVCIGWSDMGDMSSYKTREDLAAEYDNHYSKNVRGKGQDVGQLWRFMNDIKVGDYIIYAESSVFHIGRIESEYYYEDVVRETQDADYTNNRKVKWLKTNISRKDISDSFHKSLMTAMSVFSINDYKSAVYELLNGTYKKDEISEIGEKMKPNYTTGITTDIEERNRIIFGAPGTGKSFLLNEDKKKLLGENEDAFERVTFHPDYTYSQFVGAYKPIMDEEGKIRYDFVPGPFMRIFVKAIRSAMSDAPQPYLLLIEEINRAKVAAVFGDVFQLLDRDSSGVSEYDVQTTEDIRRYLYREFSGQAVDFDKIKIPDNMFIWATMNSADQGVYPMDTAFKRRWNFEYLGIDEKSEDIQNVGKILISNYDEPISWDRLRRAINAKMASNEFRINEDKLMGPYFLSKKVIDSDDDGFIKNKDKFIEAFKSKVIMYLYEDAVKQNKHKFFDGCDSSKYSSVCDSFDKIGMDIFGTNFVNLYYDEKENDSE